MATKTPKTKLDPKKPAPKTGKNSAPARAPGKPAAAARRKSARAPAPANGGPRALSTIDDNEVLLSGGSRSGVAFGRCGGRILSSRIEQRVCDMLARYGVTHSHAPRHFEVRLDDERVAAYAPMIVLRVRGREGKTVVLEAAEVVEGPTLAKVRAFRQQYGVEFYVCVIAPEDVLDDVPMDAYDEAAGIDFAHTLISRLSD